MTAETSKQTAYHEKKISELTAEDRALAKKPVGIPGLPYPMTEIIEGTGKEEGRLFTEVGVVESSHTPLTVYTETPVELVNGRLFREMPTPSMMIILRDILMMLDPDNKRRLVAAFGYSGDGKSHMFKMVGELIHPKGAIVVDCGGMNMHEIFFRTVIDYGTGVKDLFQKYLEEGRISRPSIDYINEEFPDAVVTKDGLSFIDWDRVGARRTAVGADGSVSFVEDRGAAQKRGREVMERVFKDEDITAKDNAFGIKTVPGEWFEAKWQGRPLFLDEFTKAIPETLDSCQTAFQFDNGEIGEVTLLNTMATEGSGDGLKSITVRRDEMKTASMLFIAGNESSDGSTTHELSFSMLERVSKYYVAEPTLDDWKHRISQVATGLPLSTLYTLFQTLADQQPDDFAGWLQDLRKLGLNETQVKVIPPEQRYWLQNFQNSLQALNQYAEAINAQMEMSDTSSEKYGPKGAYAELSEEVSAFGKKIRVSFRTAIADLNSALIAMPAVRKAAGATLNLSLKEIFSNLDTSNLGQSKPGWHNLGANLSRAVIERIENTTKDMPKTQGALLTLCKSKGIVPTAFKEAKASNSVKLLADLLKYDALKDMGGTESLLEVRAAVMAALRGIYPALKQEDERVIPLEALGRALKVLDSSLDKQPKAFVVSNDNLERVTAEPLVAAEALPSYELDDPYASKEHTPVNIKSILAGLAMQRYEERNHESFWPRDIMDYLADGKAERDPMEKDAFEVLMGTSRDGLDIAFLAGVDDQGNPAYLTILRDKERRKSIIMGPEKIGTVLQSELQKNGISYVVKSDPVSQEGIDKFMEETMRARHMSGASGKGDTNKIVSTRIKAFSMSCQMAGKVKEGSTLGKVIQSNTSSPAVFTSIVRKKQLGM